MVFVDAASAAGVAASVVQPSNWYRADAVAGNGVALPASGSTIANWRDVSDNNKHTSQPDASRRPTIRYGEDEAATMVCALTHDDPTDDCGLPVWKPTLVGVLAVAVVVTVPLMLVSARRRRRG